MSSECATYRMNHWNMSLEEVLTIPVKKYRSQKVFWTNNEGRDFYNVKEICDFYNISETTYKTRHDYGWNIERIIHEPLHHTEKERIDFNGIVYETQQAMFDAYGISRQTFYRRINAGYSLEEALTMPKKHSGTRPRIDHKGNRHRSFKAMCEWWGINKDTCLDRLEKGWSLCEALEIPLKMHVGEMRVSKCLDRLHIRYVYNRTIKRIFMDLNLNRRIDWDEFIDVLTNTFLDHGYAWSKKGSKHYAPILSCSRTKRRLQA